MYAYTLLPITTVGCLNHDVVTAGRSLDIAQADEEVTTARERLELYRIRHVDTYHGIWWDAVCDVTWSSILMWSCPCHEDAVARHIGTTPQPTSRRAEEDILHARNHHSYAR